MLRRILSILMLFGLLGAIGTFSAGCEERDVQVKEKKVEVKRDATGTKVESKEKKVITEPDGTRKEVTTEEKTKTKTD
jgi:hypothetical protein